jgi:phosphatidylinositol alpha-1,6-mannosyltransferase
VIRQVLRRADRVVAPSGFTRSRAIALGVDPSRCDVILPPVDVRRFPSSDVPARPRRVVTVARLMDYKGHDVVIRAVALARRALPDIEYMIVGDGPHRPSLEALVAELDLSGCVHFAGKVDDVRPYLRDSAVFVLASRSTRAPPQVEGFGIAFAEASATGRPVIGGRSGGVPEAVQEGVTGFLVDPEDPIEISQRIVQLLEDPALAARLGRQGREWVARALDPDHVGERILAIADERAQAA